MLGKGYLRRYRNGHHLKDSEIVTLAAVTVNPHINNWLIENRCSVPRFNASRILRWHSYHISLLRTLTDADYAVRLRFCQWSQQKTLLDLFFFFSLRAIKLTCDEAEHSICY
ncbi:hypothetical protein WH47_06642 [Habropoda laboriosa]|uniref:Uncharacterized protein n=1 Tax=Habropoda laboriosa TaxID=597456 RepID=A0A0L7QRW5_9HYME|nr:hypothetical protein WH47_06642 [Habropoda laboriosa]